MLLIRTIAQILMVQIMLASVGATIQSQSQAKESKKVYRLEQEQTLNLSVAAPVKISIESAKSNERLHSIPYTVHQNIVESDASTDNVEDIFISIHLQLGEASFYFAPLNGFQNNSQPAENLKKEEKDLIWDYNPSYIREYLSLKQGVNRIKRQELNLYLSKQPEGRKLVQGPFCIVVLPKKEATFSIKLGPPSYKIIPIDLQKLTPISVSRDDINNIYSLQVQDDYVVRVSRKKGFPTIKIYECQEDSQCYVNQNIVPPSRNPKVPRDPLKFQVQSMLGKFQQFSGTKCSMCNLYLEVLSKQSVGQIEIKVQTPSEPILLKQNEILHEETKAKNAKKYRIQVEKEEMTKFTVQVYEGQVKIQIKQTKGTWEYSPAQSTGVISVQIPNQPQKTSSTRSFILQIEAAGGKDAKYSLVYSSGEYEIFIKDGYPTSHVLQPKKNISFFYYNQQIKDTPMYLSLNVNNSKAFNSLKMKVFYFKQSKLESKNQYTPAKQNNLDSEAKSFIVEIPGNYPKLEAVFESTWSEPVEIAVTINDEQIIFLPLNHSLPLQIDRNGGVNLLIKNSEEGFIELVIKKCDESYPKIAYSLSPQDFMKQIYDYESLGDNQRITKSNIKVKKGGGLYIRISGDGITSSFLQITARYIQFDHKKGVTANPIKKGSYGELNYQLITNSKAEIWFKQLQCSSECQKSSRYECYWSTSKSDMFRSMICPNIFLFKNNNNKTQTGLANTSAIKTEGYKIVSKPGRDGIVSFKQILGESIIYLSIKAINQEYRTQLIYKDIEIVTIAGQISRMSSQFLFISIGVGVFVTAVLLFVIRRQARLGYTAVNTSEIQKRKKTKLEIIKG